MDTGDRLDLAPMEVDRLDLVPELREKFFKKFETEGLNPESKFHAADIARAKTKDDWLLRFLKHHDNNVQEALDMMWEVCEWRKEVGANDLTEDSVNKEYLADGVCFVFGKDKDGKKLFVIKSKLHTKNQRDFGQLQKCIIYLLERLEREGNDQVTLFFDMVDAGLSNVDMDFMKYLIGLFKSYYPYYLNYIIILEMPWILQTAFRIIKSWLPVKAIPKIKTVNKNTLKEWVHPDDALICWGGNNEYVFTYSPESEENLVVNGKTGNKKVHFNEESPTMEHIGWTANVIGKGNKGSTSMISISPEILVFNTNDDEVSCTITLKNMTQDTPLSYKLKTTSPEKFRVRPSSGILLPDQQSTIKVVLQAGYQLRGFLNNDRFMIMCIPITDANIPSSELSGLWRKQSKEDLVEQHRLLCRDARVENGDMLKSSILSSNTVQGNKRTLEALFSKVQHLEESNMNIQNQVRSMKHLLVISIILTICISMVAAFLMRMDFKYPSEDHCHLPRHGYS